MRLADPVHVRSWRAELALGYERRGERTVLASRRHDGPLVVQKPLYPEGDAVCHTILVHPPGGVAGGDELVVDVKANAGAHVLLTTPAAAKWYRTAGPEASQHAAIRVGAGACVEWLPQEAILYDGSRTRIDTRIELAAAAAFIGWDIMCLGRVAHGERYAKGECRLLMRIAREGRLLWSERGVIAAGGLFASSPVGLGGRTVFGTLLAAAPSLPPDLVRLCRSVAAREGMTAVTQPPGVLVVRYLGHSSEAARDFFQRVWQHVRPALCDRAAAAPRIWST